MVDTTQMNVTDGQFDLLSHLLDVASMRHQVIAQNVANVNTPGYHRRDVSFEEALSGHLGKHPVEALLHAKPQIVEATDGRMRADGNNVDIDVEMGRLSKNTLLYNTYAQILANRIATMRSAITGR